MHLTLCARKQLPPWRTGTWLLKSVHCGLPRSTVVEVRQGVWGKTSCARIEGPSAYIVRYTGPSFVYVTKT
ncbi:unnamed protein product [Calypogeia fissa]